MLEIDIETLIWNLSRSLSPWSRSNWALRAGMRLASQQSWRLCDRCSPWCFQRSSLFKSHLQFHGFMMIHVQSLRQSDIPVCLRTLGGLLLHVVPWVMWTRWCAAMPWHTTCDPKQPETIILEILEYDSVEQSCSWMLQDAKSEQFRSVEPTCQPAIYLSVDDWSYWIWLGVLNLIGSADNLAAKAATSLHCALERVAS